jgi:hypothetical protein
MKNFLKLICVIATSSAIISCGNATPEKTTPEKITPDKIKVARHCEKMVNEKLLYEGKVTTDIDIIKDGDGLVIVSVQYGYGKHLISPERSIYCGSNGTIVAVNNKLSELQAVLNL